MTVVTLTVQDVALAGITPAYVAVTATDGVQFLNDGNTFLQFKNTNGATRTATLVTPATVRGVAIENPTVVVPITTGDKMIGPFAPEVFNDAAGMMVATVSAFADLTAGAFRVRPI